MGLLEVEADLAIVVGGYNSSNTSHIADLCATRFPTYFINGADEIKSHDLIRHFKYAEQKFYDTNDWLPSKEKVNIVVTSGASCPDRVVEEVMQKLLGYFDNTAPQDEVLKAVSAEMGQ